MYMDDFLIYNMVQPPYYTLHDAVNHAAKINNDFIRGNATARKPMCALYWSVK